MSSWHYWIIVGIILLILEIFTPGFVLASFGVGCFTASLVAYLHGSLTMQLFTFSITTLVVFVGIRPVFIRFFSGGARTVTGVEALRGKPARVIEAIDNVRNQGRVKIGGEEWKAASVDGQTIDPDATVIVERIEGVTAYVKKNEEV